MARSGVDEFYEIIRLLAAKAIHERTKATELLDFSVATKILEANSVLISRFVEASSALSAPPEVINECLGILQLTFVNNVGYETLDAAFEGMTSRYYKSDKGQYFTPRYVVDFCIDILRPKPNELICDPACGSAAFLQSAYKNLSAGSGKNNLYGFDISKRAIKTANFMSFLACDDNLKISQIDSLNVTSDQLFSTEVNTIEKVIRASGTDFRGFDIIATNPPFAGDVGGADYSSQYELARIGGEKTERDVLFIERCLKLLKPGGRLAIILPDNKVSGAKFKDIRRWLIQHSKIIAIVSLHGYTFRPHTSQKAAIIFAEKSGGTVENYDITMYRSDKPGKTSVGEQILKDGMIDHDLNEIRDDIIKVWKI